MAKLLGRLFTLAAVAGAAAAAVSYYRQYHDFHKDLEEEFHDFEDEDAETVTEADFEEESKPQADEAADRSYVTLNADKDEFTVAAKDTLEAAKGMATSAGAVLKDVGQIIADNLRESNVVAGDTVKATKEKVMSAVQDVTERLKKTPK